MSYHKDNSYFRNNSVTKESVKNKKDKMLIIFEEKIDDLIII